MYKRQAEEVKKSTTKIDEIFIADSGVADAKYPGQVIESKIASGEYKLSTEVDLTPNLIKEPSDETKNLSAQVDEYVKAVSYTHLKSGLWSPSVILPQ